MASLEDTAYRTGTVSVVAGGTTVSGVGTIWTGGNVREGENIYIGAVSALIVEVVSAGVLTITPWPGSTQSGVAYKVYQNSPRRFDDVEIADDLRKQVQALNLINYFIPVQDDQAAPDPSLGDESQRAFKDLTGAWWKKEAGVWNLKGNPYGLQPAQNLNDLVNKDTALSNLGGTVFGRSMFTAANNAAGRQVIDLIKQSSISDATANRVMMTGAFGLGGAVVNLLSSDNAITSRPSGFYYCNGSSNTPNNENGWLTVRQVNSTYCVFEFVSSTSGQRFTGDLLNATWSGWKRSDTVSGSNSVGNWTRLPSGLVINTQKITFGSTTWSTAGWGSYCALGDISLPAVLTTPLAGVIQVIDGAVSARSAYSTYFSLGSSVMSGVYLASPASAPGTSAITVHISTMGLQS